MKPVGGPVTPVIVVSALLRSSNFSIRPSLSAVRFWALRIATLPVGRLYSLVPITVEKSYLERTRWNLNLFAISLYESLRCVVRLASGTSVIDGFPILVLSFVRITLSCTNHLTSSFSYQKRKSKESVQDQQDPLPSQNRSVTGCPHPLQQWDQ